LAAKTKRKQKQSYLTIKRALNFWKLSLKEIHHVIQTESIRQHILLVGESHTRTPIKAIKRLISLGRPGDAIRLLNSNGVHRTTPEVLKKLENLHPLAEVIPPEPPTVQFVTFNVEQIVTAVNSFPKGSSAGPFGLSAGALSSMISDTQLGSSVLNSLAAFCSNFVCGRFPSSISPYYGSARLIPLVKRDNGVRPLAVGDTLRRLACKLALTLISADIGPLFQPFQLGVGCPNGSDTIIHSVASRLESLSYDECILQVDFSNAFNMVDRATFIRLVKIHFPQLSNITNFLYQSQAFLIVGPQLHLRSYSGVQQGDPLAPLLFALVLRDLTLQLNVNVLKLNQWYLDDGHLSGKIGDILEALSLIEKLGPERGIYLNRAKCVMYITQEYVDSGLDFELASDLRLVSDGLTVLGSPIGSANYVKDHMTKQVNVLSETMQVSAILEDPQYELLLLRCCSGAPKITYWTRTCDPAIIMDNLHMFDSHVDRTLQHILGSPVREDDRLLMHLPLSMGGLGIPIASISADAAFVASIGSTWSLQQSILPRSGYTSSVLNLSLVGINIPNLPPHDIINLNNIPQLPTSKEFSQKKLMSIKNCDIKEQLLDRFDVRRSTIITGRTCHGANYWLTSPPNWEDNSYIDPAPFRLLLKHSLGMPLILSSQRCPDCNTLMDIYGDHATTCKTASGVIDKHNSIVKCLVLKMKNAGMSCSYEAKNLNNSTRQRPGDIFVPEFDNYGDAYFDISVINITCKSHLAKASQGPLMGADIRYVEKMKKYPDLGPRFKPLVIESSGGWHKYSLDYLKTMAAHISSRTNKHTSIVLGNLLRSCSFALQRNQGTMLVRRCLGLY
jgi:hypothetical protein